MIQKRTVFILGAGASMPYGFPSGEDLVRRIVDLSPSSGALLEAGFTADQIGGFCATLRESAVSSIDSFLEHRRDLQKIGKACIALILIGHEGPGPLYQRNAESWYNMLADRLDTTINRFPENKLSIITFNYDRSIDQYLFRAFKQRWDSSIGNTYAAFANLKIIHLHGQIGTLPWQGAELSRCREYRPDGDGGNVLVGAEGIKIISDQSLEESPDFIAARQLCYQADRIYILGFGYHQDNMRRLDLPLAGHEQFRQNLEIVGTAFRMTDVRRTLITKRYPGLRLVPSHIGIREFLENDYGFVADP
jgi:hypothetical protein